MGIILFLIDTSASMNQKTYLGASYLDVAKVAVETFLKYRSREPSSRYDRYMLVSFDEPPSCIKAGWKTNNAMFVSQLKNLQATSLSSFGRSLRESFDLLNLHRLHTSIDHYGQGRNPFFLEPAVVIALTDGGRMSNSQSVEEEVNFALSCNSTEGSELTSQPFRWDQRLYTVLLRLPGIGEDRSTTTAAVTANASVSETSENGYVLGDGFVASLCEMTGGKSYVLTSQKSLVQCMESLTQKLQPGVVISFKKIGSKSSPSAGQENMEVEGADLNANSNGHVTNDEHKATPPPGGEGVAKSTAWHSTRKMILVKNKTGFWPVPEPFWVDTHTVTLPPRDVHPVVWFEPTDVLPVLVEKFPFDKYELEPSPLTQCILGRRTPNVCWEVFVNNSGRQEGLTHSFGYLKASSSLTHVTLFVMPFNYRVLLPLAEELLSARLRPSSQWRQKFTEYISTVPPYYAQPLRKAFEMIGAPSNIIPESFDGQMSYSITNYLRKLKKQAKLDSERTVGNVSKNILAEICRRADGNGIVDLGDGISLAIGSTLKDEEVTSKSFRNPFDITRSGLLSQLSRMRMNFLHSTPTTPNLIEEVVRHQVPIGQMGNYQEHLKRMDPLREVDETGGLRTQLFGNPYKLERPADKTKLAESADMDIYADEHMVEMNRKPNPRVGEARRRTRLRSPSPFPARNATPHPSPSSSSSGGPAPSPPTSGLAVNSSSDAAGQMDKHTDNYKQTDTKPPIKDSPLTTTTNEITSSANNIAGAHALNQQSNEAIQDAAAMTSANSTNARPEPFKSSSLPDERGHAHTTNATKPPLNKLNNARKRERTPSPTPYPNPKRNPVSNDSPKVTSTLQILKGVSGGGGNNHVKAPSPVPSSGGGSRVGGGGKVDASRVLSEEMHKQQGQDNAKLKSLIVREVRRQGKNYDTIFQHLEEIRGSPDIRDAFVSDVIKEAGKFKRKKLVHELEEWRRSLVRNSGGVAHVGGVAHANKTRPVQKR